MYDRSEEMTGYTAWEAELAKLQPRDLEIVVYIAAEIITPKGGFFL